MNSHLAGDCLLPCVITSLKLIIPVGSGRATIIHSVEVILRAEKNVTLFDAVYLRYAYILDPDINSRDVIAHLNNFNPALNTVAYLTSGAGYGRATPHDCRVKAVKNC